MNRMPFGKDLCGASSVKLLFLLVLLVPFTNVGLAQNSPLVLGELVVSVQPQVGPKLGIHADASQAPVARDYCRWFPLTDLFDYRYDSTVTFSREHTNRHGCPGREGSDFFAYGNYKITINGNHIYMDYRDADYLTGEGDHYLGDGYENPDLWVYYNRANGNFYKDVNLTELINGYIAIWQDGRKEPAFPKIPVTITNTVPPGGVVMVDGSSRSIPYEVKWDVRDSVHLNTHTLEALSSQTADNLVYGFVSWSDGGARQHNVVASLDNDQPPPCTPVRDLDFRLQALAC